MYSANDSPRPFSLRNAFSDSQSCALLRWIRRWTANLRFTWAHSRLTGLSSPWASSSFDLTVGYRSRLESPRFFLPLRSDIGTFTYVWSTHTSPESTLFPAFSPGLSVFFSSIAARSAGRRAPSVPLQTMAVTVGTFSKRPARPLSKVEDVLNKRGAHDPFRKFRDRPQGKVATSTCARLRNSIDIVRKYTELRTQQHYSFSFLLTLVNSLFPFWKAIFRWNLNKTIKVPKENNN